MAYEVLARKYRPQRFGDLVGQEHIARTLSQAILRDRVAHAFLFTGVRGAGKTSAARILAKTLNCLNRSKTETDPCGQCDACLEIAQGVDIDVFEIDGASNNSVDDIRKLQEILPYRPTRDPYRVVIIDEVHMLSSGAFNALLKTLEEPPSHVKFIFATTEAQKVPLTVRSRCQRFDFRLISEAQIVERLSQILSSENVTFEVEALRVLAREAAGSMRDALTLLDQIIAYDPEGIRYDKVLEVLGIAHEPTVLAAVYAVLNGEADKVFDVVAQVADHGLDMLHFAKQLQTLLRDLVYHRVTGEQELSFELSREALSEAQERLANVDNAELIRAFYAAGELVDDIARSQLPRMMLEMGLVSMAARPSLKDIGEVLSELREQEQRLGTAPASVVKPSVALAPVPARSPHPSCHS